MACLRNDQESREAGVRWERGRQAGERQFTEGLGGHYRALY